MESVKNTKALLKVTSKDSLLLALRIGIPIGYVLVALAIIINVVAFIHPSIERPPYPVAILILVALPIVLVCLLLSHRAVRHELRNRRDEPSQFGKTLWRVLFFAIVGLFFWLALFCAVFFALQELTTISVEFALELSAGLPILLLVLCGGVLARKEIALLRRSHKLASDRCQKPPG